MARAVPGIPSTCWKCRIDDNNGGYYYSFKEEHRLRREIGGSRVCVWSGSRKLDRGDVNGRWRLSAVDTRIAQSASSIRAIFEIPVTCYQVRDFTDTKAYISIDLKFGNDL